MGWYFFPSKLYLTDILVNHRKVVCRDCAKWSDWTAIWRIFEASCCFMRHFTHLWFSMLNVYRQLSNKRKLRVSFTMRVDSCYQIPENMLTLFCRISVFHVHFSIFFGDFTTSSAVCIIKRLYYNAQLAFTEWNNFWQLLFIVLRKKKQEGNVFMHHSTVQH